MSQSEIYQLLKKSYKWFSSDDIMDKLNINRASTNAALKRLTKSNIIEEKDANKQDHIELNNIKNQYINYNKKTYIKKYRIKK